MKEGEETIEKRVRHLDTRKGILQEVHRPGLPISPTSLRDYRTGEDIWRKEREEDSKVRACLWLLSTNFKKTINWFAAVWLGF